MTILMFVWFGLSIFVLIVRVSSLAQEVKDHKAMLAHQMQINENLQAQIEASNNLTSERIVEAQQHTQGLVQLTIERFATIEQKIDAVRWQADG